MLSPRLDGDVTKSGGKQGTSVRSDSSGYSMQTDDPGYIQLCKFICPVSGADQNEMSNLGQGVYYNPHCILASPSPT